MHIDLKGRRVIVTGASRGIGAAIAKGFAREGARLAICARNADAIGATATDAGLLGAQDVIASTIDVRETEQVRAWIDEIAQRWGGVDVLVNNAGIAWFGPNTQEIVGYDHGKRAVGRGLGAWQMRPLFIYATAAVLAFGILGIQQHSEFIYFRF